MCAGVPSQHSRCQNSVETEIIRGITHAHAHSRTAGLSVEDRYEKGVVLTHWLSGMLQPQHLTGPYLPWAGCTSWYASVIFVGKKDTAAWARWVKKTGYWHKLTSLRFLHDRDHLLVSVDSLVAKLFDTNISSQGCAILWVLVFLWLSCMWIL